MCASDEMQQLKKIRPVHEHIMDTMLECPDITLRELGVATGYSVSYLSIMTNSDAFRARFAERKQEVCRTSVDIPTRMRAIAAVAMEKLGEHVERSEDADFLRTTADMMLHRLGYAPQRVGGGVTVNAAPQVQFVISRDDLAQARGQILEAEVVGHPAVGRETKPLEAPLGVPLVGRQHEALGEANERAD